MTAATLSLRLHVSNISLSDFTEQFKAEVNTVTVVHGDRTLRGSEKLEEPTTYLSNAIGNVLGGCGVVMMKAAEFSHAHLKSVGLLMAAASMVATRPMASTDLGAAIASGIIAVVGMVVVPDVLEKTGLLLQQLYPYVTHVAPFSNGAVREIECQGAQNYTCYEVDRPMQPGFPEVRKVSCENDWAIVTPMRKLAIVSGQTAVWIEAPPVNKGDSKSVSVLMTRTEAQIALNEGKFPGGKLATPDDEGMVILQHGDVYSHPRDTLFYKSNDGSVLTHSAAVQSTAPATGPSR